jgi:type II secretory pathway pseudopilin PulG
MNRLPDNLNRPPAGLRPVREAAAFSLIEVLVVITLLSIVVLALMDVFSSTQRAFRAAVTQSDILEGSRAAMDLITSDLRAMTPSGQTYYYGAVNFQVTNNLNYCQPLVQSLPGSFTSRSNLLQQVFILKHENNKWWGVAYAVVSNTPAGLNQLYRLQYPPLPGAVDPSTIYTNVAFTSFFANPTNAVTYGASHLLDGVVHFVVRAYDHNGNWIPNANTSIPTNTLTSTWFYYLYGGEGGCSMYSNNLPGSVELQMAVVEDRALQRAESFGSYSAATNYLAGQSGAVHVFRQIVAIPNVDRSAYQ